MPGFGARVFLRLMRVEHHETIRSPEAYLFTVASHVLHQHTLRAVDHTDLYRDFAGLRELQLVSDDDPSARVDAQQRLEQMDRALEELPPKISTTLLLHRFAGFSIEEIGQKLEVASYGQEVSRSGADTVSGRLRGRWRVRKLREDETVTTEVKPANPGRGFRLVCGFPR